MLLLAGVSLSSQSYYDTNYGFGGNYGVSSFGIGSFGFGGSAIGGHGKSQRPTYIFKPKKVRHYPFKHKILKHKPSVTDQWSQPSNYAIKPMEMWPQSQLVLDGSYLNPVPVQPIPLKLYPSLEDILKLSNPQTPAPPAPPVPSIQVVLPPPATPTPVDLSHNLDGIVKLLTSQLSTNQIKPSYTSWLPPDFETNSLAQTVDLKGNEFIQETINILSTTQSPIFDLDILLRKPRSMQ